MQDHARQTPSSPTRLPREERGQTLVEFALVIPMLMVLLFALLELGLALNASLAVNRASQHGAHVAATAGNIAGADCLILDAIEEVLGAPNDVGNISEILVERNSLTGDVALARQRWLRGGSTDCTHPDGTVDPVPYTLVENGYPEAQRCTVLSGCPALTPARTTVDNVGITVRYRHDWVTPLNGALALIGPGATPSGGSTGGWSFEQRNIFRMEPSL